MAAALLSASLSLPPKNGEVGGFCKRNFRSSICGKVLINPPRRRENATSGGQFVVSSLLRRGTRNTKREVVVPEPDYRIPIVLLGLGGGLAYANNLLASAPVGLLGLLLFFQIDSAFAVPNGHLILSCSPGCMVKSIQEATRVRFVFDDEALEVKVGEDLQESGENVFVGGKNRWKYSTFVNWELWWPNFPILVYFKETQTKPEGQVHFFPVIFNGKQLYDVMVERAGPSKTSGPKQS